MDIVFIPKRASPHPRIGDLDEGTAFRCGGGLYIKHAANGMDKNRVYDLANHKWSTLESNLFATPVSLHITATHLI